MNEACHFLLAKYGHPDHMMLKHFTAVEGKCVYARLDHTETDIKALILYAHIWYRGMQRDHGCSSELLSPFAVISIQWQIYIQISWCMIEV
jgi:hypothetical protein